MDISSRVYKSVNKDTNKSLEILIDTAHYIKPLEPPYPIIGGRVGSSKTSRIIYFLLIYYQIDDVKYF